LFINQTISKLSLACWWLQPKISTMQEI